MMKKKKLNKKIIIMRIIFTVLLLSTFIIIFDYSGQNGEVSSNTSSGLMYRILDAVNGTKDVKIEEVERLEPLLRKLAHFCIYMTVGIWAMCLMCTYFYNIEETKREQIRIYISVFIGFIYACSDEIHQLFSNGRSGNLLDVIIDTIGVATGVSFILLVIKIYKKYINEREKEC